MAPPALRADAARNRDAIVAAAGEVFSEQGIDAPLDEIATRAGIANATLYRRFSGRAELVEAVFADRMAEQARLARILVDGFRAGGASEGPLAPSPRRMEAAMRAHSRQLRLDPPPSA